MSIDSTALPSELLVAPQPLIGLCGLDVNRNAVHKTIWDAFSSNRKAERASVQFKLLPNNYDFPVAKPKRNSYEWYHPKGILKRNWMLKHLHVLPAVVVLFQDIEWNDAQWTEKQLQCAALLQGLKNALQERNTRICLVLLQESPPLPPGEDMLASERAASLTTACGINSKMLFILAHTEHLVGYVLRLESAFVDMAQSYYTLMSKRIRTHRDQLTAAHTTLKIRHQFKLGFVAEIRQDFSTALKHYTQSYTTLDELRINDGNNLEIKTVAGFLNYKICRLMFKLKVPRDSINHFISHIDKYKNRVGFKDLLFEHYAWLSTQHFVFAELFCEAIKNGLPALQTQHPGIYFHKAAEYIQKRKEAFQQSNGPSTPTESPPPTNFNGQSNNITSLYTEYFGIRSMKSGEPLSEQQINALIRENEKLYNHSSSIINLLSLAMAQFKIYKCLRFRKKLAIDMADEYFKSGDHSKALTLYSLMLPDYRQDKWCSLFSDVLLKTMKCALLSGSVGDFISCSLEALSCKIKYTPNERIMVLENLWKVLHGEAPVPQNQNAPEVRTLWEESLKKVKSPLPIDLDKLTELLEICTTFEKIEIKNDDIIKLNVILRLQTDVPIKIRNLQVIITDGSNNYKLQPTQYAKYFDLVALRKHNDPATNAYQPYEANLKLEPTFYHSFLFTTEAQQFLENTQLRVVRIETFVGTDNFSMQLCKSAPYTNNAFRYHNRNRDLDDNIIINPICYIAPTFHLVTQCNLGTETMLVNEYYMATITITNPYNVFVTGIALSISVPNNLKNKVFLTTDVSPSKQKLHSIIHMDIGELAMQSSNSVSFYVLSLVETSITLQQRLFYTTDVLRPKVTTAIIVNETTTPNSTDVSPEGTPSAAKSLTSNNSNNLAPSIPTPIPLITPVQLEFIDENSLRKTQDTTLSVKCEPEFKFHGRFYTLNRKPLTKIYRGENFLFRAGVEVQSDVALDILETFFICDHNLVQSTYSFKRKKFTNTYAKGEKLEDVIVLRTNDTTDEWLSAKDYERNKTNDMQQPSIFKRLRNSRKHLQQNDLTTTPSNNLASATMTKSLLGKLNTNMTIINNTTSTNALMMSSQNSNMSSSTISDDGKTMAPGSVNNNNVDENGQAQAPKQILNSRLIYNKTLDAINATGHLRGFLKGSVLTDQQQSQHHQILFGFYCVKWRRSGSKEENESKFVIMGMPILEPPLNVYCSMEEKMFVKMPITFKVVLKNPTSKVLHLIASLSISIADNFICSGHKQLDISIFAFGEKELVYNLYPLQVGWQNLPELSLVYNTQADPTKDEAQNVLLGELVQRSILKKVFVLPPLKQQMK
ncbi:trafficking protein particle complex subunit 11 [Stomoxys calcitrans]|uniref:Trafficking protein particle complex subunit 11 n=1 Tax=Stomoxys calcitrans TaxID=35570 RepID=A0A1I8QCZ3_STOCA|nr:trafficking protein particle complex subunit 11 [Stomoxys calcitrans]